MNMTGYIGKRINCFITKAKNKEDKLYYESSFAFTIKQCREYLSDMLIEKNEYKIVKINFEEVIGRQS